MLNRPYPMMRKARSEQIHSGGQISLDVELELANTFNVSAQSERISIRTLISLPLPNHPQAIELAALRHARDALDAQIAAIQQPP
jgi:hypothetical protein